MDNQSKAKDRFENEVFNHTLKILRDDGQYRHVRLKNGDSCFHWFDIITWPGSLCINGDMGSYTFSRTEDMFKFFGTGPKINPGYWGEKLRSKDMGAGYRKFSSSIFEEKVIEYASGWEFESENTKNETMAAVRDDVLSASEDGEERAYQAALDFKSESGHTFVDFWEINCRSYTFQYLWCLHAIVFAIKKYREHKGTL